MKQNKKFFTVRKKLIAAIASLAVALIMVVSSTYAWFTLSTAPEVTGITTQIGSNGNLEIALVPTTGLNGIQTGVLPTEAQTDATKSNLYWGNLIDLSDASYGLGKIALKPAALNVSGTTASAKVGTSILATPVYNDRGNVTGTKTNTVTGTYILKNAENVDINDFTVNSNYGVRAIGASSSKNAEELAITNAKLTLARAAANISRDAQSATTSYGGALASIAVKHVNGENSFTKAEMQSVIDYAKALKAIVDDIVAAVRQVEIAYHASVMDNLDTFNGTATAVATADITTLTHAGLSTDELTLLNNASTNINAVATSTASAESYNWDAMSAQVSKIINTSTLTVEDITLAGNSDDIQDAIASKVLAGEKVAIEIKTADETNGGVLADIADFVGAYSSDVKISGIQVGSSTPTLSMNAVLTANTSLADSDLYLKKVGAVVTAEGFKAKVEGASGDAILNDIYGYELDFAFRTNAAESKLLLQTEGAQRIYGDSTNTATQGSGSYLEFSFTNNLDSLAVAKLISNIRIVFTDDTGLILAIGATKQNVVASDVGAKADDISYEVSGNKVRAYIKLYEYTVEDGVFTLGAEKSGVEAAQIVGLNQNTATLIKTIVYLDGANITDEMVDPFANIAGTMNLQFASSATLVPAESDLH